MKQEFSSKRVVVMGLGRFGGGLGVARWLCAQGARVLISDQASRAHLSESIDALKSLKVDLHLGGHDERDLKDCDLLVVSPAVHKRRSPFFGAAMRRGIPWTTEMNLFLERCPATIIGITGTVGKSTTTAMIETILTTAGSRSSAEDQTARWDKVWIGGNIGRSLLDDLTTIRRHDLVVLELSSFQLEDAAQLRKSPQVSVVTNIRDNHLDRHGTLQAYAAAKANIYRYQTETDWLVLPFGHGTELLPPDWRNRPRLCRFDADADRGAVRIRLPDRSACDGEEVAVSLAIPGAHNLQNAAAALSISRILNVPDSVAVEALGRFRGLPHRLELIREYEGARYYNDSKATTPEAAQTSLDVFDGGIIMLVGGSDKGSSFAELGRALARRAKGVICMGATRDRLRQAVEQGGTTGHLPRIVSADGFSQAVTAARELAEPGDVVLLSPGCASFDWFRNYEQRGKAFRELVMAWR